MKKYLKYFFYISPIIVIAIASANIQKKQNETKKINESVSITDFNKNFSSTFSLNNNIQNIFWESNDSSIVSVDNLPAEYTIENSSVESIQKTLIDNYKIESQPTDLGNGDKLWSNNNHTLFYNGSTQKIDFQFPTIATFRSGFIEEQLIQKATEIINTTNIPHLKINTIEYYKTDGNESIIGEKENSRLAKVGFVQQLDNNMKVIPQGFIDNNTVTLTIDSSLNPRYLMINKAIKNYTPTKNKITDYKTPVDIDITKIHRITPFSVESEDIVYKSTNNKLTAKSVEVAYTQINDRLYPIYIISGDLYSNEVLIGKTSFVAPIK